MYEPSWIAQIFSSHEAQRGGVVRRCISDVRRISSSKSTRELIQAVQSRGFHMVEMGDQCVIDCRPEAVSKIVC